VVYCHPSGGGAARAAERGGPEHGLLAALADAGHVVVAPDLGGPSASWGSPAAVEAVAAAAAYVRARGADPGPVVVVGASMGAVDMHNFARARPGDVAALAGLAPVCDLEALYALGADDLTVNIARAWGVEPGVPLPPEANPARAAREIRCPWLGYFASDDPLVPAASVEAFAGAVGGRAVDLGPVGHDGVFGAVPVDELIGFVSAAASPSRNERRSASSTPSTDTTPPSSAVP
jgi:pimeloyl-ACP methyl ester carboxylesterase